MCSTICTILNEIAHCAYFILLRIAVFWPSFGLHCLGLGGQGSNPDRSKKKFKFFLFVFSHKFHECTQKIQGVPLENVGKCSLFAFSDSCVSLQAVDLCKQKLSYIKFCSTTRVNWLHQCKIR